MKKILVLILSLGFASIATSCSTTEKSASEREPGSESSDYAYEKHLEMLDRVDRIR